jgi:hypothetical protein
MIDKLGYEKLMEENNLKLSDLNEEARIGIKTITDVKKSINMLEKKGKTVSEDVIKKIKANDKWICGEILEIIDGKQINKDDVAPHGALEIIKDVSATASVSDNNTPAVDETGIKIDADLKKAFDEGKKVITSDELKIVSPEAYDVIAKGYEKDGENGLDTSFYSLREKETGIFELKEL